MRGGGLFEKAYQIFEYSLCDGSIRRFRRMMTIQRFRSPEREAECREKLRRHVDLFFRETERRGFPLFCPKCRRESVINGKDFIMESKEAGRGEAGEGLRQCIVVWAGPENGTAASERRKR